MTINSWSVSHMAVLTGAHPVPGSAPALPGGTDQALLELGFETWPVHPVCESSRGLVPQALLYGTSTVGCEVPSWQQLTLAHEAFSQ